MVMLNDKPRKVKLNRDKRFRAPVKRRKIIAAIATKLGWRSRGNNGYFLFRDHSKITTDETGHLFSTGGKATKAFFKYQVFNIPLKRNNPSNQGSCARPGHSVAQDQPTEA